MIFIDFGNWLDLASFYSNRLKHIINVEDSCPVINEIRCRQFPVTWRRRRNQTLATDTLAAPTSACLSLTARSGTAFVFDFHAVRRRCVGCKQRALNGSMHLWWEWVSARAVTSSWLRYQACEDSPGPDRHWVARSPAQNRGQKVRLVEGFQHVPDNQSADQLVKSTGYIYLSVPPLNCNLVIVLCAS